MTATGPGVPRRRPVPDGEITWEPSERHVRGRAGDQTVVDSRHPILVRLPGLPVPLSAFPEAEVRTDLLRPAEQPHRDDAAASDELAGYLAFEWPGRPGHGLDHWYEEDGRLDLLEPTDLQTGCPYKGTAEYWSLRGPSSAPPNIAWSYPGPVPAVEAITGHVAFYNEAVDITVDGERLERPESPFSKQFVP